MLRYGLNGFDEPFLTDVLSLDHFLQSVMQVLMLSRYQFEQLRDVAVPFLVRFVLALQLKQVFDAFIDDFLHVFEVSFGLSGLLEMVIG